MCRGSAFTWFLYYRYIAVTQPIKYAKHKNNRRVWLTILLVWAISAAIGSPIVLGLNNTPERLPDLCLFYNSDFIIYSSLSSFYIPCIIMVFLYYNIFKVGKITGLRCQKRNFCRVRHVYTSAGLISGPLIRFMLPFIQIVGQLNNYSSNRYL